MLIKQKQNVVARSSVETE